MSVGVSVGVGVGVLVGVGVGVHVGVLVGVAVGLNVWVGVAVGTDVWVGLGVRVSVGVGLGVGVARGSKESTRELGQDRSSNRAKSRMTLPRRPCFFQVVDSQSSTFFIYNFIWKAPSRRRSSKAFQRPEASVLLNLR